MKDRQTDRQRHTDNERKRQRITEKSQDDQIGRHVGRERGRKQDSHSNRQTATLMKDRETTAAERERDRKGQRDQKEFDANE